MIRGGLLDSARDSMFATATVVDPSEAVAVSNKPRRAFHTFLRELSLRCFAAFNLLALALLCIVSFIFAFTPPLLPGPPREDA